jgi:hypothetical protein
VCGFGCLQALKFLNGLKIDAATLIAKVDSKVQTMLDDPANASTAPPDADAMASKIITDLVNARKAEYEAYAVTGTLARVAVGVALA